MFMLLPQTSIPSSLRSKALLSLKILQQFVCLFLRISVGLTSLWPRSSWEWALHSRDSNAQR